MSDETDATPRKNGYQPPSEQGDDVAWIEIDAYRDRIPLGYDEEWTIRSISRRFAHGERASEVVESPTGESVTLGEPHWYVTAKRDRFPHTKNVTAEYDHFVFPDIPALAAWFDEDEELVR